MTGEEDRGKQRKKRRSNRTGQLLQQIGLNMVMVGVLVVLAFLVWQRVEARNAPVEASAPAAEGAPTEAAVKPVEIQELGVDLSPMVTPSLPVDGIIRTTNIKTIIPSRPRSNVITYTVQAGDTLFSIAQNFGIKPETILWGNYTVLEDNPHLLKPKQELNILPTDGTYYEWQEGDRLSSVADFFQVDQDEIINYPGNFIDLTAGDPSTEIKKGTWLIIPGGKRAIKDWGPPAISRSNPAVARYYGEGACGAISSGAMGSGTFIWPTTDHSISGYAFDGSVHPAIDIGGQTGNPVYATDGGVVVYAGWSNYGYGNLIVIDHGTGWQSAYAHLDSIGVGCGQSVYQGGYIGALGSTGNSSGPHLHFELAINGAKVNPYDYVR
jgi:murein DD-endopeptidase MepM/ murein hydrolase activator NlpD